MHTHAKFFTEKLTEKSADKDKFRARENTSTFYYNEFLNIRK